MGFFESQTKTVRIDAQNSAVVRKLTFAERQQVMSRAMKVDMKPGDAGGANVAIDAALMAFEMTKIAVVSWDGPGWEGREVTADNVAALPPAIGDLLSKVVDQLNQSLRDDEKKG